MQGSSTGRRLSPTRKIKRIDTARLDPMHCPDAMPCTSTFN
ncbi:hypothetical protein PITC_024710 [Penicillium italicum]|uniref:Uncharacterized protein n=1 Tax=Penicillium italicum TaxID=40296 RepID=A0A0A2LFF8_PENIT|nr:hypothetical protein PITC_024710 [Penicillium italicum]